MSEIVKAALIVAGAVIIGAFIITYWVMASLCSMQDSIKSLKAGVEDVAGAVRAIHFNTDYVAGRLNAIRETLDEVLRPIYLAILAQGDSSVTHGLDTLNETVDDRLTAIDSNGGVSSTGGGDS